MTSDFDWSYISSEDKVLLRCKGESHVLMAFRLDDLKSIIRKIDEWKQSLGEEINDISDY